MEKDLIKKYEKYEEANCKFFGDDVVTVFFWILAVIGGMFAFMFSIVGPGEEDMWYISFIYCMFTVMQMSIWQRVRYGVKENNISMNVYYKLLYVPVNLKALFITKAYRMLKCYMLYAVSVQVLVLLIHVLYNGGFRVIWVTFVPLYAGIISVVTHVFSTWIEYRQAIKQI